MVKTLSGVVKILKGHKIYFFVILLCSILINFSFIVYIDFVRQLINSVIQLHFEHAFTWIGVAGVVLLVDVLLNRFAITFKKKLYCNVLQKLRLDFFKKIIHVPLPTLEKYLNGDLITRFTDDIVGVTNFISDSFISLISNMTLFIMFFVYIVFKNLALTPVIFILLPSTVYIVKKFGSLLSKETGIYQKEMSALNSNAKDLFDYRLDIKSFGSETYFLSRYGRQEATVVQHAVKRNLYRTIVWALGVVNYQVIFIFFYVVGGILAFRQIMDFGLVIGLYMMIDKLVDLLMTVPGMFSSLYEIAPKLERSNEILNRAEQDYCGKLVEGSDYKGSIVKMSNVMYSYDQEKPALDHVSLNIQPGERIAIVGESGSGKSTLLKMLIGYDDRYTGEIEVSNQELRELAKKSVRQRISYCPQIPFLLSRSIRENFTFFHGPVDQEKLNQYARMVELEPEIHSFEHGYDTILQEDGKNLSGGQKQRLGLMLGLMKESEMYLIDEGFSALDPEMTKKVLENIFAYINGTVVVVTHKLYDAVMNRFDRIIVVENGKVVGIGNHQQLMDNMLYRTLYKKSNQEG